MNTAGLCLCVYVSAVPPGDALPKSDDRGTNSGHVQRSSHGPVPQPPFITPCHHHQWHGNCRTHTTNEGIKPYFQPMHLSALMYSPLLFFFSCITQVIPNYSSREQYEKMFALGVSM